MPFAPVRFEHALRGHVLTKAAMRVNRRVLVHPVLGDYTLEDLSFGDLAIAKSSNIEVLPVPRFDRRRYLLNEPIMQFEDVHIHPSGGPSRNTNWLLDSVQQSIREKSEGLALAFPVQGVELPGGREVFCHNIIDRISQTSVVSVLSNNAEHLFSKYGIYAYRPSRSHVTALHHARIYMRRGYYYLAKADIKRFFPSCTDDLVARSICECCGFITKELLAYIISTTCPRIYRARLHGKVKSGQCKQMEPPMYSVLPGSTLGPMLSNFIGFYLIDRPFREAMDGRAILLRYADDMLIMSADEGAVREGLALLRDLADPLVLHTDESKTSPTPVDSRVESVRWLGKDIGRGEVRTPEEKIVETLEWIADGMNAYELNGIMKNAFCDLLLEPVTALNDFVGTVWAFSSLHEDICRDTLEWWTPFRKHMLARSARLLQQ